MWETRAVETMGGTWVFGYGSLADVERLERFLGRRLAPEEVVFGRLRGYRRSWNVATDNRLDLPGYKMYLDPKTGERPEVYVTFLNLRPVADGSGAVSNPEVANGAAVNGVAFRVSEDDLDRIRARERNYRLIEVTGHWISESTGGGPARRGRSEPGPPHRILVSVGRPEAVERFREGRQAGRAVVRTGYRRQVHAAFRSRGGAWWKEFRRTTDPPGIPERDLERVELP